jgi:pheromone shutdown protein TraB
MTPSSVQVWRLLIIGCWTLLLFHVQVLATGDTTSSSTVAGFPPSPAFVPKNTTTIPVDRNVTSDVAGDTLQHEQQQPASSKLTATTTSSVPDWKRRLPFPLNNKTQTLQRIIVPGNSGRSVEIYLLGTAHVSTDSSRDVRLLLDATEPDIIFLELCDQRIPMLVMPPAAPPQKQNTTKDKVGFWQRFQRKPRKSPEEVTATTDDQEQDVVKPTKSMYSVAATLLTNMQEDYAQSLGVELGGEFRVAYEYWDEICQAAAAGATENGSNSSQQGRRVHMILGDRPLYLTLTRAWESLRLWGKTKLLVGLLLSSFHRPNPKELQEWMQSILLDDSGDLLSKSIAELAQHFPTLEEVIIRERDAYMACKLYQTCRHMLTLPGANNRPQTYRIVAIVGAGHVNGICKWLTEPTQESPEEVLAKLVQLKKNPMAEEDLQYLVHDIMEVNPDLLKEILQDLK